MANHLHRETGWSTALIGYIERMVIHPNRVTVKMVKHPHKCSQVLALTSRIHPTNRQSTRGVGNLGVAAWASPWLFQRVTLCRDLLPPLFNMNPPFRGGKTFTAAPCIIHTPIFRWPLKIGERKIIRPVIRRWIAVHGGFVCGGTLLHPRSAGGAPPDGPLQSIGENDHWAHTLHNVGDSDGTKVNAANSTYSRSASLLLWLRNS